MGQDGPRCFGSPWLPPAPSAGCSGLTLCEAPLCCATRLVFLQHWVAESSATRTWPSRAHMASVESPLLGRNLAWKTASAGAAFNAGAGACVRAGGNGTKQERTRGQHPCQTPASPGCSDLQAATAKPQLHGPSSRSDHPGPAGCTRRAGSPAEMPVVPVSLRAWAVRWRRQSPSLQAPLVVAEPLHCPRTGRFATPQPP